MSTRGANEPPDVDDDADAEAQDVSPSAAPTHATVSIVVCVHELGIDIARVTLLGTEHAVAAATEFARGRRALSLITASVALPRAGFDAEADVPSVPLDRAP